MGRERRVRIPTGQNLPFSESREVSFFLPLVYLYKQLTLRITGTLTMAGAAAPVLHEDGILELIRNIGVRLTGKTPYLAANGKLWEQYALRQAKIVPTRTDPLLTDGAHPIVIEIPLFFVVPSSPISEAFAFPSWRQDNVELFIEWNSLASLIVGGAGTYTASGFIVDLLARVDDQRNVADSTGFFGMRRIQRTHTLATSAFAIDGEEYEIGRNGLGGLREVILIARDNDLRSDVIATRYQIDVSRVRNQDVPYTDAQDLWRQVTATVPETGVGILSWDIPDARMENALPIAGETELQLLILHGAATAPADVESLFEEILIGQF